MKKVSKKKPAPRKKKRIILGVGYPWYPRNDSPWPSTVKLYPEIHGGGEVLRFKIGNSGAYKKYRLVLEEV